MYIIDVKKFLYKLKIYIKKKNYKSKWVCMLKFLLIVGTFDNLRVRIMFSG